MVDKNSIEINDLILSFVFIGVVVGSSYCASVLSQIQSVLSYLITNYQHILEMFTLASHSKRWAFCAFHSLLAAATSYFGRILWMPEPEVAVWLYLISFLSALVAFFLFFEDHCEKVQENLRSRNARLEIIEAFKNYSRQKLTQES